eukprot:SAG31_NODE_48703_length_172_cov_763.095890_1_plen_25_part_01
MELKSEIIIRTINTAVAAVANHYRT